MGPGAVMWLIGACLGCITYGEGKIIKVPNMRTTPPVRSRPLKSTNRVSPFSGDYINTTRKREGRDTGNLSTKVSFLCDHLTVAVTLSRRKKTKEVVMGAAVVIIFCCSAMEAQS